MSIQLSIIQWPFFYVRFRHGGHPGCWIPIQSRIWLKSCSSVGPVNSGISVEVDILNNYRQRETQISMCPSKGLALGEIWFEFTHRARLAGVHVSAGVGAVWDDFILFICLILCHWSNYSRTGPGQRTGVESGGVFGREVAAVTA